MMPEGYDILGFSQMPGAPLPPQGTQPGADKSTPLPRRPNRGQAAKRFMFPSDQLSKRGRWTLLYYSTLQIVKDYA